MQGQGFLDTAVNKDPNLVYTIWYLISVYSRYSTHYVVDGM